MTSGVLLLSTEFRFLPKITSQEVEVNSTRRNYEMLKIPNEQYIPQFGPR